MEAYERYDKGGLLHDRYLKVADISEGLYGLVSLAKDTAHGDRLVAVKYIYPLNYKKSLNSTGRATSLPAKLRLNQPEDTRKLIMTALYEETNKEIRIHKILEGHPNVPELLNHFDSCLVLEYCARGDLYEAMQNDMGPSTSHEIKEVFGQILGALAFCHNQLVYHRDLKPENILIGEDWGIKICDWGLATTQRRVTDKNEFDIGLERYMAPELFDAELEYYDAAKIDLWSLGVILVTLVFHKNPFQVANYADKRFLQFSTNREALFDFFSTMSAEMFSALRFCLNLDPANRDLDSLQLELERLRFFTIDEEYWAEHSDEEEEEDDEVRAIDANDESEDDMFKFEQRDPLQKKAKKRVTLDLPESDREPEALPPVKETKFYEPPRDREGRTDSMPHNRRAEALLSPGPIPIGGGKMIRNTRKPFGVALYNKNVRTMLGQGHAHTQSNGGRFRREDWFTPRSVVNHYMDKYGEQRERENRPKRKWNKKKRHWTRATWGKDGAQGAQGPWPRNGHDKRRPSRKRRGPELLASPPLPATIGNGTGNGKLGKYVPPCLRLPNPRSADTLTTEIEQMSLNDGVFAWDEELLREGTGGPVRLAKGHNGKYVPPFRRGSHSEAILQKKDKRRSVQPLDEASHSAPRDNWLLHKEWRGFSD